MLTEGEDREVGVVTQGRVEWLQSVVSSVVKSVVRSVVVPFTYRPRACVRVTVAESVAVVVHPAALSPSVAPPAGPARHTIRRSDEIQKRVNSGGHLGVGTVGGGGGVEVRGVLLRATSCFVLLSAATCCGI